MSINNGFKCLIELNSYRYTVIINNNTNYIAFRDVFNEIIKIDSKLNISTKTHVFEVNLIIDKNKIF